MASLSSSTNNTPPTMNVVSDLTTFTLEILKRMDEQDLKIKQQTEEITELKRQIFQLKQSNVQSLNGKSNRKTYLKESISEEMKTWAENLRTTQEKNASMKKPSPLNDKYEPLALYLAAEHGEMEKAKLLLSQGYDLNRDDQLHPKFGTTPLMEACFHGRDDMAKLYIEHNADLNTQSGFGWTALHYAGQNNKLGCVQLLLAAGCNKDLKNAKGKTALDRAKKQGKTGIENAIASAGGV